jgi:hypothetical protein
MTLYINEETGEYPRHIGDIQSLHPDWKLGQELPSPWVEVVATEPPNTTHPQTSYEIAPEKINGVWVRKFEVYTFTEEELEEIESLRQ